jgi:Domain of unknown function (DUF4417)/ParB-like nuclease domain
MPSAMELVMRPVKALVPYARNSKEHPPEQVEEIARSMQEFGWTNPILLDGNNGVIAGHGRILAAQFLLRAGIKSLKNLPDLNELPCIDLEHLSATQKRAYIIADNKLAANAPWNVEALKVELLDLKGIGYDLSLTGFTSMEVDSIGDGPDSIDDVSEELEGAAALKTWMEFPSDHPYGLPAIRDDMLAPLPAGLKCFAGQQVTPDDGESWYLWLWRSDSLRGLPRDRHVIGFYVDDYRFECLWEAPAKYVAKMLNMGTRIALGVNYSILGGWPLARQLWQLYRARWVTRYMQEAGIAIIPDMNFGDELTYQAGIHGFPRNAPCVSVQIQTVENVAHFKAVVQGVRQFVRDVTPQHLMVYGSKPARKVMDEARVDVPVTYVLNRSTVKAGHIRVGQSESEMA